MARSIENVLALYQMFANDLAHVTARPEPRGKNQKARRALLIRDINKQLADLQAEARALGYSIDPVKS